MLKPFMIEPKLSGNSFHFQMPIYMSFFWLSIDLTRCKLSKGSCHEKEVKEKSGSWSTENAESRNSLERKGEQLSETSGGKCLYRLDWSGARFDLNAPSLEAFDSHSKKKRKDEKNCKKRQNSLLLWYNSLNRPNGIKLQAILLCIIVMNF